MHPVPLTQPANLSPAALRTFFRIVDRWGLRPDEARTLLGVPSTTYFRWRRDPARVRLGADTLERISYVLGIYKALRIIYTDEAVADLWLKRPNDSPVFGGHEPLFRMLAGQVADLFVTRQHLDARRGVV